MAYPFELPQLGYDYAALEPHIDARTMEIHHDKHHQGYTSKLNAALEKHEAFHAYSAEQLLRGLHALPDALKTAVRNNGGGYHNHALFWRVIAPGGGSPSGDLGKAIDKTFGSLDGFKAQLSEAAGGRFGSGWGWLAVCPFGDLHVFSTANQDSPLMDGFTPILGVDVWEHAYYLKYQNRRPEYLKAFWEVVNWDEVSSRYAAARDGWIKTVAG